MWATSTANEPRSSYLSRNAKVPYEARCRRTKPKPGEPGGWNSKDFESNYRQPAEFQLALTNTLQQTDEYVWLYSEHFCWLPPSRNVSSAYLEAVQIARKAAGLRDLTLDAKPVPTTTR